MCGGVFGGKLDLFNAQEAVAACFSSRGELGRRSGDRSGK